MIFWFTGNTGSGKSTIVDALQNMVDPRPIILDGNKMRKSISVGAGFSKEERAEHNYRVARLANVLNNQGFTILVSVIAPFEILRDQIEKICMPNWIYIKRISPEDSERPYEPPSNPAFVLDTNAETPEESIAKCLAYIKGIQKH